MKNCLIVSGGEFCPVENIHKYDLIIACDRGYEYCGEMGIKPDVILGDFDSYKGVCDENIKEVRLNPIKDDTDTISAVKYALKKGCDHITICCALGGRFDHSIANLQTVGYILENGAIPIVSGLETIIYGVKNGSIILEKTERSYLSIFALSDICVGVSVSGTKYELKNSSLTNSFPLGVSNEWVDNKARISVEDGKLAVMVCRNAQF